MEADKGAARPVADKSGAPDAGWQPVETQTVYEDKFQRIRKDAVEVRGPGGESKRIDFTYQQRPPGILIVPVTPEGEILLIRQYRYAVDAFGLEVPAGGTQDTGDMPPDEVARKELHEEIGAVADEMREAGWFWGDGSLSDIACRVFLATGVRRTESPEREPTERTIEVRAYPAQEAMRLARSGGVRFGPSALALLLCEPLIEGR